MSHRIRITLTDDQYERLRHEADATGVRIGDLVRRAIDSVYGQHSVEEKLALLHSSFGAWKDREGTTEEYVEFLRPGPGFHIID
jgi:hypothetical protein